MRGFSLIEVLVSFGILIIMFAGIFAVLNVGQMNFGTGMASLDLQQQARQAMDGMTKEIRQGCQNCPNNPNNITIASDGSGINFTVPINITADPITYSSTISYYLNEDNQVVREYPAGTSPKILANDITNLSFCYYDIDSHSCIDTQSTTLQIHLGASKTVRQKALTPFNLTEQVRLRNE